MQIKIIICNVNYVSRAREIIAFIVKLIFMSLILFFVIIIVIIFTLTVKKKFIYIYHYKIKLVYEFNDICIVIFAMIIHH